MQGESDTPSDNFILGKYVINGIEPQQERETIVDISYSYNENGMVDVSAVQRKTGKRLAVTNTDVPDDVSWMDEKPVIVETKVTSSIYLAIDASGSMYSCRSKVRDAARRFVNDMDLTCSKIGVIAFNANVNRLLKLSSNVKDIYRAIDKATADPDGGTNGPLKYLEKNFGTMSDKNYIVVLTDGEWFDGDSEVSSAKRLKNSGIEIVALGIGDANASFLRKIASSDEAALKTDLNDVSGAFSSIAQAITEGAEKISLA